MHVAELKLLWVNVGNGRADLVSRLPFERLFAVTEVGSSSLSSTELEEPWDAILFDFDYPDMSGLKLIPDAKVRWPSAPILMLTLQSSVELAVWALRSRVFDLAVKPATPKEIERMLERVAAAISARRSQIERRPQGGSA